MSMCFSYSGLSLLITDILCDLSLVVLLTHDFVIATQGSVSFKHTMHTLCLSAFPVCIVAVSCVLLNTPVGNCTRTFPLHVHFTVSGIKAETARLYMDFLAVCTLIQMLTHKHTCTHMQSCGVPS